MRPSWPQALWAAFAAVNVAWIVLAPSAETIPFHFVWVSLTLLYAVRPFRTVARTALVLGAVCLTSGGALAWTSRSTGAGLDEVTEVPLMAAMFVALVWHARRGQAAMDETRRLADSHLRLLRREREFVGNASHELRTPITVAAGHAELIRGAYAGQQAGEDAEVVIGELNRLARMSDRLLLLAAVEQETFLRAAEVDLAELVAGMERRWRPTANRSWAVRAEACTVLADQERLESAVDALIENAVKFTEEGDRIELAARPDGEAGVITVADTGTGIPREGLDRIFDRFYRGATGRGRTADGNGLGLAIARAIVEAHGGAIAVRSELGRGTLVEILLPGVRASREGTEQDRGTVARVVSAP